MPAAAGAGRGGQGDLVDPGRLGGDDVHDHAGGVGAEAAGGVHPGPAQGHEPLGQPDARALRPDQVGRALGLVEGPGPLDGVEQGGPQLRVEGGLGIGQLVRGGPPAGRGGVDPVEPPGRLGHGGVATGGDVVDQLAHPGPGRLHRLHGGAGQHPGRVTVGASQVDHGQHANALHSTRTDGRERDSPYRSPPASADRGLWTAGRLLPHRRLPSR